MNQARVDMVADTVDDLMTGASTFLGEKDEARKVGTRITTCSKLN